MNKGLSVLAILAFGVSSGEASTAVCVMTGHGSGYVVGVLGLSQEEGGPLSIKGVVEGLSPGKHGFHIHVNGSLEDDCKAAGSHYNPYQKLHGAPEDDERHIGDLGNIVVEEEGVVFIDMQDNLASIIDPDHSIIGRAIVVHEGEDDLGKGGNEESTSTGNAGARAGCCIINPA